LTIIYLFICGLMLQVDLVAGFAEIKERIHRLISVEIPKLELCDVMSLKDKG